jgi:hypothetical protein
LLIDPEKPLGSRHTGFDKHHSVFDPSAYRNLAAKWHFPQENAAYQEIETSTYGSKAL